MNKTVVAIAAIVVFMLVLPVVVVLLKQGPAEPARQGTERAGAGSSTTPEYAEGDPYTMTTATFAGEQVQCTAIGAAILSGDRQRVQAFLDNGADINRAIQWQNPGRPPTTLSAVQLAVRTVAERNVTVDFIGFLVDRGADVNRGLPLHAAVASGRDDLVRTLIALGADVNARNRSGYTPLGVAERLGAASVVIDVLRQHGAAR